MTKIKNAVISKNQKKEADSKISPESLSVDEGHHIEVSESLPQVKGKRGRKSKKELMAALNLIPYSDTIATTSTTKTKIKPESNIDHLVEQGEIIGNNNINNMILDITDIYPNDETNIVIISNPNLEQFLDIDTDNVAEVSSKQPVKKRGRKPKGGKIIQQVIPTDNQTNDKPNVILHLKCSMKDLNSSNTESIDSYSFNTKHNLAYDLIGDENINSVNVYHNEKKTLTNSCYKNFNSNYEYENDDDDNDSNNNDGALSVKDKNNNNNNNNNKEIWRKLKVLEHSLHINNVNNKKSACFWDSCDFDNPPIYIPKHYINGSYHVYGCFCSPECGVAYLMNENIDSSTKFERYHLFNHIYSKIYDYKKNIKPSPNPHYMLEKFYGNLSIQEYRSLLRNERLFIIVDKPLTRILPELHDDNDEFILNNKIIPSNSNHQLKSRMNKKKPNKNSILNEKFGISASAE
jgi:hypothetical protein